MSNNIISLIDKEIKEVKENSLKEIVRLEQARAVLTTGPAKGAVLDNAVVWNQNPITARQLLKGLGKLKTPGVAETAAPQKRVISEGARKRMAAGQKKRWASFNKSKKAIAK